MHDVPPMERCNTVDIEKLTVIALHYYGKTQHYTTTTYTLHYLAITIVATENL